MGLPAGAVFEGRYEVRTLLGEGGFAQVYEAMDRHTERLVALKVTDPGTGREGDALRARFDREVVSVAGLRDPHTIRLFDFGKTADGLLFTVFEHIDGRDLSALLTERGRLEPRVAIYVVEQVLQSLHEAHAVGLLHRDLKPENILVYEYMGDEYRAKLLDFGIAKRTDPEATSITLTGAIVGTPRYMSPEQLRGERLSPASDIYSLGLVLMELLLGREALSGTSLGAQLERVVSGHAFELPTEGEWAWLWQVVGKMCARAPEARYPSAMAVLAALRRQDAQRTRGPTLGIPPADVAAGTARRPWLFVVLVLSLSLLVLGAVFASGSRRREPEVVPVSRRAVVTPRPAPAVAEAHEEPAAAADARGAGCGKPAPGGLQERRLEGLQPEPWSTYLPADYDPMRAHAVLFVLHAHDGTAELFLKESGFARIADREGFIVVAPDAPGGEWDEPGDADALVLKGILDETAHRHCVDRERVFAAGHIAGGHGAMRLSCADWVTGVASFSARPTPTKKRICAKPHILFSAMDTDHARPEGGTNCRGDQKISLAEHEAQWQAVNACDVDARTAWRAEVGARCFAWDCAHAFVSCHVEGGHNWPGASQRPSDRFVHCDGPNPTFPIAEAAWRFFAGLGAGSEGGAVAPDMD